MTPATPTAVSDPLSRRLADLHLACATCLGGYGPCGTARLLKLVEMYREDHLGHYPENCHPNATCRLDDRAMAILEVRHE